MPAAYGLLCARTLINDPFGLSGRATCELSILSLALRGWTTPNCTKNRYPVHCTVLYCGLRRQSSATCAGVCCRCSLYEKVKSGTGSPRLMLYRLSGLSSHREQKLPPLKADFQHTWSNRGAHPGYLHENGEGCAGERFASSLFVACW